MKKLLCLLLAVLLLTGCSTENSQQAAAPEVTSPPAATESLPAETTAEIPYQSRFDTVTQITLSDTELLTDSGDSVSFTNDIVYYEDLDVYPSGNPYGEGGPEERHTAQEAAAHKVVNITAPGAYRITGKLSQGQIRVDLGKEAYDDPNAVVELILDNADITCTVAPAILFLNVYECDGSWSAETAQPEVDTSAAGANLILEGHNLVSGSHVAKIFKDTDGEKKLWKQDGAIYSYQSMNVFGPGSLELTADNEGLDTELHLTINGGDLHIYSDNDGINTNEDGVSVTTINGGNLTIFAGLGAEGDGIDSNGYLMINGGSVVCAANPAADAGLDSDLGSYINGGIVIAMGSTMDWAESDSDQVTMNLQFASAQQAGAKIILTGEDGTEIFSFESGSEYARSFSGLILSHPKLAQGETYHVYVNGAQMGYTSNDMGTFGPGGGRPMGQKPEGGRTENAKHPQPAQQSFAEGTPPTLPEGMELPEGFDPGHMGGDNSQRPDEADMTPPEDFSGAPSMPEEELPQGGFRGQGASLEKPGEVSVDFYMNDKVNAFSGVMPVADGTAK